jgi:hypothetical protein
MRGTQVANVPSNTHVVHVKGQVQTPAPKTPSGQLCDFTALANLKAKVLSAQPKQAAKELRHLAGSVICGNDTVATINCFQGRKFVLLLLFVCSKIGLRC